jgi:hypothetical protein
MEEMEAPFSVFCGLAVFFGEPERHQTKELGFELFAASNLPRNGNISPF